MISGFLSNSLIGASPISDLQEGQIVNKSRIKENMPHKNNIKQQGNILDSAGVKVVTPNFGDLKFNNSLFQASYVDYVLNLPLPNNDLEEQYLMNCQKTIDYYKCHLEIGNINFEESRTQNQPNQSVVGSGYFFADNQQNNNNNQQKKQKPPRGELVSSLADITGLDVKKCHDYLNRSGDDLLAAINLFEQDKEQEKQRQQQEQQRLEREKQESYKEFMKINNVTLDVAKFWVDMAPNLQEALQCYEENK